MHNHIQETIKLYANLEKGLCNDNLNHERINQKYVYPGEVVFIVDCARSELEFLSSHNKTILGREVNKITNILPAIDHIHNDVAVTFFDYTNKLIRASYFSTIEPKCEEDVMKSHKNDQVK